MSDLDPVTQHLMEAVGAYDERTEAIYGDLRELIVNVEHIGEAVLKIQQRLDRIERRTHSPLTVAQLDELHDTLADDAAAMHDRLNGDPHSTREQWNAWEAIKNAANHIGDASAWLRRYEARP